MFSVLARYTQHYNRQLLLCSSLLTLSSMNFAFDNQGFSQTQALDQFTHQFGWCNKKGKCSLEAWWLSLFNSLIFVGQGIGIVIGSHVNKHYGRRLTVSAMSCWAIICAIINITATNRWQIFAGRILNYIYVGMEFSSIPVYQAELAPAPVRGLAVASYQLSVGFGGLIMSLVIRGTSTIAGSASYRIPYGLMFITPTIIAPLVWLLPESPRFLLSKDRIDEARAGLLRIRRDATPESVDDEIHRIMLSLAVEAEQRSWKDCFGRSNLRRTLLVMGTNIFMQLTGQPFWTQYGTIFVKSLNVINPFTYTAIFHSVNIVANMLALVLVDRLGRRPILILMSSLQAVFLFVMGGMGLPAHPTLEAGKVIVGSVIMCGFFWNLGFASLTYLIMAEIPNQKLRDSTVRIGGICQVVTTFASSFTVPYLLDAPYANLQSKVGFIYGSCSALAALYVFCFIPELKNRSFEEVDILFFEKVSAIGSSKWKPSRGINEELDAMAQTHAKTELVDQKHTEDVGVLEASAGNE